MKKHILKGIFAIIVVSLMFLGLDYCSTISGIKEEVSVALANYFEFIAYGTIVCIIIQAILDNSHKKKVKAVNNTDIFKE